MENSDESKTRRGGLRWKYSKMDKRAKISWLSHLERMEENRMPKKIFTQELEGTKKKEEKENEKEKEEKEKKKKKKK